ncbi:class I SAM-dependent methyltransferase [Mycobacterium sp. C3-094]|uniref:class I SAM-dependent methyltransferase n=1 Tax=Mycobacterium sp. PSTR-4-N TaxID=2917745 RepID=UPI001F14AC84|nr:class I SAM-dependent methyltransferase [Mycobacterium sp. PSTR-4-N]MCG7594158.1 methyltransferase domain-containing protein [Mycobacterium sp. PSTR-4-N]
MSAEFDTVAEWTAEVARDLGPDYHVPAGCRGSGNPAALDWLIERLGLRAGETLLDCGAGVGGPAAYAVERRALRPVLVEPEAGACRAAVSLFGYPTLQGSADALPLADESVDAAWCLGVLCTMRAHTAVLAELRRVVRAPGRIGLLVFVAQKQLAAADRPEGNHFPTQASLRGALTAAGLVVDARLQTPDLPAIPDHWQTRVTRVEEELAHRHGGDPAWETAERQSAQMGDLLSAHRITGEVLSLRRAEAQRGGK